MAQLNTESATKLYNAVKDAGYDIGDYNEYITKLNSDPANADNLYKALSGSGFDIGSDYKTRLYPVNSSIVPTPAERKKNAEVSKSDPANIFFTPEIKQGVDIGNGATVTDSQGNKSTPMPRKGTIDSTATNTAVTEIPVEQLPSEYNALSPEEAKKVIYGNIPGTTKIGDVSFLPIGKDWQKKAAKTPVQAINKPANSVENAAPQLKMPTITSEDMQDKSNYPVSDWVGEHVSETLGGLMRGAASSTERMWNASLATMHDMNEKYHDVSAENAKLGLISDGQGGYIPAYGLSEDDKKTLSEAHKQASDISKNYRQLYLGKAEQTGIGLKNTTSEKIGGLIPLTAAIVGGAVSGQPQVVGAGLTGAFVLSGMGEGRLAADNYEKQSGVTLDEGTKSLASLGYGAVMALPIGKLANVGGILKYVPKNVVSDAVGKYMSNLLRTNPELVTNTGKEIVQAWAKQAPGAAKAFMTDLGKATVHSVATMSGIGAAQNAIDQFVIGKDVSTQDYLNRLKEDVGSGITMAIMTAPFAHFQQSAAMDNARKQRGEVTLSVNEKGQAMEIVPDGEGNMIGLLPNGKQVKVNQADVDRAITMTYGDFKNYTGLYKSNIDLHTNPKDFERTVLENRLNQTLSRVSDKDGNVSTITSEGKNYYYTGTDKDGNLTGVDGQGNTEILGSYYRPEIKVGDEIPNNGTVTEVTDKTVTIQPMSVVDENGKTTTAEPVTIPRSTFDELRWNDPELQVNVVPKEAVKQSILAAYDKRNNYDPRGSYQEALNGSETEPIVNKPDPETVLKKATEDATNFVAAITHKESGNVIEARLRGVEQPINITKGNIVLKEDGSVDLDNSDKTFFYKTPDGVLHVGNIEFIEGNPSIIPAQEAIDKSVQPVREQLENDNAPEYSIGSKQVITDNTDPQNPANTIVTITGRDENGNYKVQRDLGGGKMQPGIVQPREILPQFAGVLDTENAAVNYIDPETGETRTGRLELDTADKQMMFANGYATIDGKQMPFENVVGDNRQQTTDNINETNGLQATEAGNTQGELGQGGNRTAVQEEQQAASSKQQAEEAPKSPEGDLIPTDEKGNLLFEQARPEATIQFLKDNFEKEEIVPTVEARINAINKEISKQETFKPSGNIQKDALVKQAKRQALNALNEQLGYWKDIQERVTPQNYKPQNETVSQRDVRWGEPVSLREMIIRKFIGGVKLRWDDEVSENGTVISRGLGGEYRYGNDERKAHFNFIAANGVTPEQLAHSIWQANAYEPGQFEDMPLYGTDTQDILNEILDVMNSYRSIGDMIKSVDEIRDQYTEQEKAYIDSLVNDEENQKNVLETVQNEIDDATFAEIAGVIDLTEEQHTELQNLQNDVTNTRTEKAVIGRDNTDGSIQQGEAITGDTTTIANGTVDEGGNKPGDRGIEGVEPESNGTPDNGVEKPTEPGKSEEVKPKGITVINEEDNGKTLVYGTKNNQTRLSVVGLNEQEIKDEISMIEKFVSDAIKMNSEIEKYLPVMFVGENKQKTEQTLKSNNQIIENSKVTIPWLKQKLSELSTEPIKSATEPIKNGSTVTYQGKQYTVNGITTDGQTVDLELNGKTVHEDVPVGELSKSEKTQSELDTEELDNYIAEQEHKTNPTDKQKETGVYPKARISLQGHNITIETLKGTDRTGTDSNGKKWSVTMNNHYGELDGTIGYDGDAIDVFIGPNPKQGQIFVIDQLSNNGTFDESKVMLGFKSAEEAKAAYMSNYEKGWKGFGSITPAGDNFKAWLYDGKKQRKPYAEYKETPEAVDLTEQPTEKQSSGNKLPEQDLSVLNDAKTQLDNALKTINAKDLEKAKGGVGISAMYFARKFVKTPDTNKPLYDAIYNYYFDTVSNYQLPEQAKQPWEMTREEWNKNVFIIPVRVGYGKSGTAKSGDINVQINNSQSDKPITDINKAAQRIINDNPIIEVDKATVVRQLLDAYKFQKRGIKELVNGNVRVILHDGETTPNTTATNHKLSIQQAISEGKQVPENVLADYPELKKEEESPELPKGFRYLTEDEAKKIYHHTGEKALANDLYSNFSDVSRAQNRYEEYGLKKNITIQGREVEATLWYDGKNNDQPRLSYQYTDSKGNVVKQTLLLSGKKVLNGGGFQFNKVNVKSDIIEANPKETVNEEKQISDKVSAAQAKQPLSVEEQEIVDTDSKIQNIVEQPKITATDEKIEDVGQKIGGAKKDLFQEYAKKLLSVTDQDIARLPLSKSFPRPNFAQLIEDGKMTQETAIFLNYFYDNIPSKPQKSYKVERWVKTVREALDTFNSVLESKPTRDLMQEYIDMLNTNILGQRKAFNAEVYRAVRKAINFPNNDVNVGNLTIIRSQTSENAYVYSVGNPIGNRVKLTGRFNTMEEAAAKLIEMAKETAGNPKQIEFSVYSSRLRGDFYITPKGKGEIVLQNGFKTSKEAFEYINENREALTDRFNAMKEIPSERRMSNKERVGFDYRQGKNVTAEDFVKEFGFRGVEFGNWVNQEERQAHINEAYDALMDLASVIGVTPRALSLNGELGFAFGSRGGGKYAAHYETNKVVINLTKTKGAGTLAHEWFHALDNYLLRAVGNKTSYATEGHGFNKEGKPALRPELNDAFRNLMKVIRKSGFYTRSAKLDIVKGSKYWGTSVELGARGFEDFVMNKLAKSNIQNDYLVNFKSLAEFIDRVNGDISEITSKYPYPTMEESEAISEAYQNLFDTIQEDDNGVLFQIIDKKNKLVALHNISEDKLLNAEKIGGLPMPSIAITNIDNGFDSFGEITLIGDKRLIDPKNKENKIFAGDAYSPRYPNVTYNVKNSKAVEKFANKLPEQFARSAWHRIDQQIEDRGLKGLKDSGFVMYQFLKEKGIDTTVERKSRYPKEVIDAISAIKAYDYLDIRDNEEAKKIVSDLYMESNPVYKDEKERKAFVRMGVIDENGIVNANILRDFFNSVKQESRIKDTIDESKTLSEARKYIEENGLKSEFNNYAENLYDSFNVEERIFKGYTPSGSRRYVPHTLDNVMKEMKSKKVAGGEGMFYGAGSARALVSPQFKSIEQIKAKQDLIVSSKDFEAVKEDINNELYTVSELVKPFYKYRDHVIESMSEELTTLARNGQSESFNKLSPEAHQAVGEFLEKLRNLPTEYFEAKITRPVYLSEFTAAIVPMDASPKTIEMLENAGLKVERYDNNRAEVLKRLAEENNAAFQIKPEAFDAARTASEKYEAAVEITKGLDEQNNTETIVARDNEEFISMLPEEYADFLRTEDVGGVFYKGNVIVNSEKQSTGTEILLVYEHEYAHKSSRRIHSTKELADLWKNATESDKLLLPEEYLDNPDWVKGDELISHAVEDIIEKQGYENYKNGNIDLSSYSETLQDKLKKTIDHANQEYLRNIRSRNTGGGSLSGNNAGETTGNLRESGEGRQTATLGRQNEGIVGQSEGTVQGAVSGGSEGILQGKIVVDGVERSTTNSLGHPIHPTEAGVRNFWKWFGNSKVVDKEGRPLVVYHGSPSDFNEFKKLKNLDSDVFGSKFGYFFTPDKDIAQIFADRAENGVLYATYLKLEHPKKINGFFWDSYSRYKGADANLRKQSPKEYKGIANVVELPDFKKFREQLQAEGNDGVVLNNISIETDKIRIVKTPQYIVFDPTQIKSATGNNGTFSADDADIRYQLAYHGGPHSFDKFSLDKIGEGEGNQSYGWGLYFTDKKDIAEGYAKSLGKWKNRLTYRGENVEPQSPLAMAWGLLNHSSGYWNTISKAIKKAKEIRSNAISENVPESVISKWDKAIEYLENSSKSDFKEVPDRNLYTVKIHGDKTIDELNFLRWDKELTENQKEAVINIFDDIVNSESDYKKSSLLSHTYSKTDFDFTGKDGEEIYKTLSTLIGSDKLVSEKLLEYGIDGVQYPTEYQSKGNHEESYNYVVFDDNAISIVDHVRFQIIGEKGATALDKTEEATTRLDNLRVAKEMDAKTVDNGDEKDRGFTPHEIRMATGWEKGVDGLWRYEVPDGEIRKDVLKELKTNSTLSNQDVTFDLVTYRKHNNGYDISLRKKGATNTNEFVEYNNLSVNELKSVIDNQSVTEKILNGEGGESFMGENWDEAKEFKTDFTTFITGGESLERIVDNKQLFSAYPELKDVIVVFDKSKGLNASYEERGDQKIIRIGAVWNQTKSTLIHEIQHAIQGIEGFAKGDNSKRIEETHNPEMHKKWSDTLTSIRYIKDFGFEKGSVYKNSLSDFSKEQINSLSRMKPENAINKLKELASEFEKEVNVGKEIGYDRYKRASGEVEARNASARMNMSEEERRNTLLAETADVAPEDQIVIMDGMGVSEFASKSPEGDLNKLPATINVDGVKRPTTNSNGKPIHGTEEGIKNFWKWFGDSKVVDKEGRPLVVYHGTGRKFTEFEAIQSSEDFPEAMYFSTSKEIAKSYAGTNGNIFEVYLKEENPHIVDAKNKDFNSFYDEMSSSMHYAKNNNNDGLIVKRIKDDWAQKGGFKSATTYITFDPTQIKSVTGNNGEFDQNDADIRFQIQGYKGSRTTPEYYKQAQSLDDLFGIGKPVQDKKGGELISDYYKRIKAWSVANNPQAWGEADRKEAEDYLAGITPDSYEAKAQAAQAAAQAAGSTVVDEPKPVFQQDGHTAESVSEFARRVVAWREQRFINGLVRAEREAEAREAVAQGFTPIDHETARMELDMQLRTVYDSLGKLIGKQPAKKLERWAGNKEMWADSLLPVKTFLDYLRSKGVKIPDIDDYYLQATALQGKNDTGFNDYVRKYQKPVNKWIHDTIKATGFNYRDIENYVFLKHGVERNEYFKQDGKRQKADYAGVYAIAAELYAKDNGIPFDPKEKNEIGKVLKEYAGANGITLQETTEAGIYDELFANKKDVIEQASVNKNRAFFDKIINDYINDFESESNGKGRSIDDFWQKMNAANDFSLDTMADAGIITRTQADEIKSRYQYFVPLRGHEVEAEKTYEYSPDAGVFFSNPAIKAHGRITRAEHPFSYIAQMAQSAVVMKNRNDLNRTMLRLARKDKTGLFSVNKTWYIKTGSDAEGNDIWEEAEIEAKPSDELNRAEWEAWNERMKELEKEGRAKQFTKGVDLDGLFIKKKQKKQHAITVIENGEEYQVYINANPRISRAINGLNRSEQDKVLRFLSSVKGMIGMNVTSRNPAFMAANFSRDTLFAASTLPAKEGGVYAAKYIANIPVAAKELVQYQVNPDTAPQYVREFFENGGETGFSHLWELQDMQKQVDKAVKQGLSAGKAWEALVKPIDVINKIVENTTRMAVYKTSREAGRTIEQSISDSKEVSLNFNRKGAGGGVVDYVRSAYLFVNASVQALNNFTKVYKEHPWKMTAVVMSYIMSGLLMSIINALAGDDDEYWNLPDYDRQNNLCIWVGNGFVKIPLPQELRVFHRIGDNVAANLWNKKPLSKVMPDVAAGLLDLIPANPSGPVTASWAEAMPDAIKPFMQLQANKSFTGAAIAKDPAFIKEGVPQWRQVRTNRANEPKAPAGIIWLSAELNAALGGDQYRSAGSFEKEVLNPDKLNHLAKGYFGGVYTTATQGLGTITDRFYLSEKDLNEKTTGGNLQNAYNKIDEAEQRVNQFNQIVNDLKENKIDRVQFAKDTIGTDFGAARKIQKLGNRLREINKTIKENQDLPEEEKKQLQEAQKTILKVIDETEMKAINN